MAVERRLTEIVGPVGGKLHTARSRNDQVATDMAMFTRAHALRTLEALQRPADACWSSSPSATSTGRCRATRTCSAPSRSTSRTTCSPTSGCSGATRGASSSCCGSTDELPLGAGALAGVNFATDRGLRRRASSASRASSPNSIDAVSNRDFVLDFLARRGDLRDPPLAPRRRDRAVVERGVRLLRGRPTRGRRAPRSCRRRRTRTRPSCCAPRRRASSRHLTALHGVMHGLPLTYNKDMQEDKEHLFDAVDTLELCLAGRARDARRDRVRARAAGRRRRRRADRGDRRRRPAGAARRAVPPVARHRRRARARGARRPAASLSELTREELARHSRRARRRVLRVLSQRSWLESKVSEGGTALARVREQLAPRARGARRPAGVRRSTRRSTTAPVARGRAGPRRLRRRATARRAGVIVETEAYHESEPACHAHVGAHRPHARPVRRRPAAPTSTAPTASTRCSTRSASPRASAPRC